MPASTATKALYRRARARRELGDLVAAVDDLQRAAKISPNSSEVRPYV